MERPHPYRAADVVLILLGMPLDVIAFVAPFQVLAFRPHSQRSELGFRGPEDRDRQPVLHRWHHTGIDQGGSKNFSATFPILDLMFGTYYMPKGERPERFGIGDPSFPRISRASSCIPSATAREVCARSRLSVGV